MDWLTFENGCSEALSVTAVPRVGNGGTCGGQNDIGPGRKSQTGCDRASYNKSNGLELYVCPAGWIPVDADDQYVTKPVLQFRCKDIR